MRTSHYTTLVKSLGEEDYLYSPKQQITKGNNFTVSDNVAQIRYFTDKPIITE